LKKNFNTIADEALQASSSVQCQPSISLLESTINQEQLGPALTEQSISSEQCFSVDQPELQVEFAATEQLKLQLEPATLE